MDNKLIKPDFKAKNDIEDYALKPRASDRLALLYLTDEKFGLKVFEPLHFFNLLYEQVGIVVANRAEPILIKKYLLNLKLEKPQLLLLLKFIGEHLEEKDRNNNKVLEPLDFENLRMLRDCRELIGNEFRKLFKELYENENKEVDNLHNRYDYAREMKKIDALPEDLYKKHEYLVKLVSDYERDILNTWEEEKRWNGESFRGMFIRERDRYKVLIDSEKSLTQSQKVSIPEFSESNIIIYYPSETPNIFCKAMPIEVAINHFKIFSEQKSKNDQSFLTVNQLNLFVQKAFLGKNDIEQQTINYSSREKQFIVSRFYQFYFNVGVYKNYEDTNQCTQKYIKLLTDNFLNWDYEKVENNFARPVKRKW